MDKAVALISEPDWAMRELMRRALEDAGFETLDSSSFVEFGLKLQSRRLRTAPRALLVLADTMSSRSQPVISALAAQRVAGDLQEPELLLTREFGSTAQDAPRDIGGCRVAAVLEKPFDFSLFQAIAYRCRTSSSAAHGTEAAQ